MSKFLWCGILAMGLGAGIVGWRYFRSTPSQAKAVASTGRVDGSDGDAGPRRLTLEEALDLDLSKPGTLKRPEHDIIEPIVTRLAPVEEPTELPSEPATTFGGVAESDADTLVAPRPDYEARRMPYADDQGETPLSRLFGWTGLGRRVSPPVRSNATRYEPGVGVDPNLAEESEEPPILERALPAHHHPPHCPYGSHCPYPYSNRSMPPR